MSLLSLLCFLSLFPFIATAVVPSSATFKYVNEGEHGPYINEYGGDYRCLRVFTSPFQLCFYNTTRNTYTLAIRMGTRRSVSMRRWVWEANRGNPVRENATLTFGTDGNLVLADADGRIAWQTNTANKGVVGFRLLPTGNMVLHDSQGKFIWQSFDSPTDILLVGQSIRAGGVSKLVSRASAEDNSNGPYSLVLEGNRLAMYYKSKNSPTPYLYFKLEPYIHWKGTLAFVTLSITPDTFERYAYDMQLDFGVNGSTREGGYLIARPKYNSTLSFIRLGIDGNLKLYTYYDHVDYNAWEETFTLFSRDSNWETECQLPSRCGSLGLCEDNQCVACPTANGLTGWSKGCQPVKLPSCNPNSFHYNKLEGVDHFMSTHTSGAGPVKEIDCLKKCSSDCKCLGYFYHTLSSKCWVAYDLMTLTKVSNSTHLGYIKFPNKS
ncbi:B_lectin domain-containing protein [Cephalotus follicularis]|uniref:B_lectin domain-containing protein n=1 Tax=Cephalotus follicularis TaxID=3775 RepID=A0A1Q3DJ76_CEPFO|nr:B_lectin domain-containing protein [Cephalotus follicularis]